MNYTDETIFDAEFDRCQVHSSRDAKLASQIRKLINQQSFAVLCTQGQGQPYGSLIAYAFSDDLKSFYFTTPLATRKFKLLTECQRVALVIDSRSEYLLNAERIDALTVTGKALHIQSGAEHVQGIRILKIRHPYMETFLESDSSALFQIRVVRYFYVTQFQQVSQWIP